MVDQFLAYLNCPIQVLDKDSMLFMVCESGFFAHLNHELDELLASLLQTNKSVTPLNQMMKVGKDL